MTLARKPKRKLEWQWKIKRPHLREHWEEWWGAYVFVIGILWFVSCIVCACVQPTRYNGDPIWKQWRVDWMIANGFPLYLLGIFVLYLCVKYLVHHPPVKRVDDVNDKTELERLAQLGREYEAEMEESEYDLDLPPL